ncbi:MAG: DUF6056 family protein [Prevotella sp.]|nr:DUF6056 family protein [Prevotella sp.]MCM1074178.1 DUF6056 family protein [Ruminococcus sp.]
MGATNEAISIPLFCGIFFALLFVKEYRNFANLSACTGLFIGILWILFCHDYFAAHEFEGYFASRQWVYLPYILPTLVLACIVIIRLIKTKKIDSQTIIYLVISLASVSIMLKSQFGARVGSFSIIVSGIALFSSFKKVNRVQKKYFSLLCMLLSAFLIVHSVTVTYLCYKSKRMADYMLKIYATMIKRGDKDTTCVMNMTLRVDAPVIALQKPYLDWLAHYTTLKRFNYVYGRADNYKINVFPQQLIIALNHEAYVAIPGNAGLKRIGKYLIGPPCTEKVLTLNTIQRGKPRKEDYHTVNLKWGNDTIAWYYPEHTSLATLMPGYIEKADTLCVE